ncbi:uncharacterized protein LOC110184203 [Drosophila serrata]|uniref:uncharacterized protein LOC110184203 n=1 Tax=Drosophila serrata TaxID=7274 RepID=UPI000A1D153F|nr:uncharacterized protein LOC110184203 [Drosophila serrata]
MAPVRGRFTLVDRETGRLVSRSVPGTSCDSASPVDINTIKSLDQESDKSSPKQESTTNARGGQMMDNLRTNQTDVMQNMEKKPVKQTIPMVHKKSNNIKNSPVSTSWSARMAKKQRQSDTANAMAKAKAKAKNKFFRGTKKISSMKIKKAKKSSLEKLPKKKQSAYILEQINSDDALIDKSIIQQKKSCVGLSSSFQLLKKL